jgi:pyruvate,water dikinase
MATQKEERYVSWFGELSGEDTPQVGGKNSSLGEMVSALKERGVRVPDGFATTAAAYRLFLQQNDLEEKIKKELKDAKEPPKAGKKIRRLIAKAELPAELTTQVRQAYQELGGKYGKEEVDVAVRSSATAEDLPEASFAGQQESFLNITGEDELLDAVRRAYASLFTDRAIAYREEQGFDHLQVALSVGVQKMVRSDKAGSGVMFTLDTDTGFPHVIGINAAWGLGENVVQGTVNPDEYKVFKPLLGQEGLTPVIKRTVGTKEKKMVYGGDGGETTKNVDTPKKQQSRLVLSDEEVLRLAEWAVSIEDHYGQPMDIEWAKDGESDGLFIVQARPETVQSQKAAEKFKQYTLQKTSTVITEGLAIGQAIAAGKAQHIESPDDQDKFKEGNVLVTGRTDPDWVPMMKKASAIVTDHGGRTSHAAIVSRELGIPAVVGAGSATDDIEDGDKVTVSCVSGDRGYVYTGELDFEVEEVDTSDLPEPDTQIMMNIASPGAAYRWWQLPAKGIGLARMEFVINNLIQVHPMALLRYDDLKDKDAKKRIKELTKGYKDRSEYFVDRLARGIAQIAAAQHPHPVVVRLSDFKTNEYAGLIGGGEFEPAEENPMLGFRGASRYVHERYREALGLECRALKRVREEIGLENVVVMVPFCRTVDEADRVLEALAENGLQRGQKGLQVYMMAEVPSNIVLGEEFARRFDGFSIGSNDLTQLVLGIDRDSEILRAQFDEQDESVKSMIAELIEKAHRQNVKVGICGQAPSDHPEFAEFLVEAGIDSISLNPDSVVDVVKRVAALEPKGTQ